MKNLKLLVVIAVFASFFACEQQVLETPQTVAETNIVKPDVYVENGYLAFKDMDAVHQTLNEIGSMDLEQFQAWEKSLRFTSAKTAYAKYFDEYEAIDNEEDWVEFKNKYSTILQITDNDEHIGVDYPFTNTHWCRILNGEGIIKLGKSLICFKNGYRVIESGKLAELSNAKMMNKTNLEKGILIIDNGNKSNLKSDWVQDEYKYVLPTSAYIRHSETALTARFEWFNYLWRPTNSTWALTTEVYVWYRSERENWRNKLRYANGSCKLESVNVNIKPNNIEGHTGNIVIQSSSNSISGGEAATMECSLKSLTSNYNYLPGIKDQSLDIREVHCTISGSIVSWYTDTIDYYDPSVSNTSGTYLSPDFTWHW